MAEPTAAVTKCCHDCRRHLPLSCYRERSDRTGALDFRCIDCRRAYQRRAKQASRERAGLPPVDAAPAPRIDPGVLASAFQSFMAGCARLGGDINRGGTVA